MAAKRLFFCRSESGCFCEKPVTTEEWVAKHTAFLNFLAPVYLFPFIAEGNLQIHWSQKVPLWQPS